MRKKVQQGFTLIELLVVVILLGIVTSFAVLSMGTGSIEREMEEEAKRLHALISLIREESIIQAKEIAMEVKQQEYSFLEYKNKKWLAFKTKVFQKRKIKQGLELTVNADSKSQFFKSSEEDLLRIYFLSSGEQTPFQIRLNVKGESRPYYQLSGLFNGKLTLEYVDN